MPGRPIRILAGIAWVAGSSFGWIVCSWGAFAFLDHFEEQWGGLTCEAIGDVIGCIFGVGLLTMIVIMTLLAMYSQLPGTGDRSARLRGFPIEPKEPADR